MDEYHNLGWFGQHPAIYDFAGFFISPIRRIAARKMGKDKKYILDIATGTGANALELAKLGHQVVGIDLDYRMLLKAHKKLSTGMNINFLHADGTKLNFHDHEFDAATISFAMHDVPQEIGIKILKEAMRVVKKDGIIFIVDYYEPLRTFGAVLLYLVARLYESPNYKQFVKNGLKPVFEYLGLHIIKKTSFLGSVQFTMVQNI